MRMLLTRIAELLVPFLSCTPKASGHKPDEETCILSPAQLNHISTYIEILQRWNSRINLTAIRKQEEIVTRHFGESLFAARHLLPRVAADAFVRPPERNAPGNHPTNPRLADPRLADLGSGAGFPGIPIKLWAPNISLTLIESNHKKAAFLRELTRALTLTNVDIQNVRAETLSPSTFDFVTIRAVEGLAKILPTAASLLAPSGRLALLVSYSQLETIHSILPSASWRSPIPIPQSHSRVLLIGSTLRLLN